MLKWKSSYVAGAAVILVAVILIAGGTASASNTGFKLNKGITLNVAPPEDGKGDNWLSLPYFNPYVNIGPFCTQVGLASTGGAAVAKATVTFIEPLTGLPSTQQCGSSSAAITPLVSPKSYLIRQPAAALGPPSLIIVGSHNPSLQISLFNALPYAPQVPGPAIIQPSPKGDNWVSIPYHTTAVSYNDLCLSSGLSSTGGVSVLKARISQIDPGTGIPNSQLCGSAAAIAAPLTLGAGVQIREPNTLLNQATTPHKDFIPAHF